MATPFARSLRSLAHDTPRSALLAWLFAGGFLAAWLCWFMLAKVTVFEVSRTARLEVERSAHPLAAGLPGKISQVALVLGQQVREGDVLVELDASSEILRLREEESRLSALPPQIEEVKEQIAAQERARQEDQQAAIAATESARGRHREAVAAASFAKDNDRRLSELGTKGTVATIDVLRARAETQKLHASAEALAADIHRLEMDAQTRGHQRQAEIDELHRSLLALEGQKTTTEATVLRLRQDIEKHRIRAPISGRLGDVAPLQVGAYVEEGDKLGSIVPPGSLRIVADFPPASVLGRIRPGQRGRMRLDGFPWAQYGSLTATVSHVASEIRDHAVRVEFTPDSPPAESVLMQHGLPGSIEVGIERLSPALLVLRAAGQALSLPVSRAGDAMVAARP